MQGERIQNKKEENTKYDTIQQIVIFEFSTLLCKEKNDIIVALMH